MPASVGRRPPRGRLLAAIAVLAGLLAAAAAPADAFVSTGGVVPRLDDPPENSTVVLVGIFVRKVYDFDPTTDTYQVTFDLWLTWPDAGPNGTDPSQSVSISNAVDLGSAVLSRAFDAPRAANGTLTALFRAQARLARVFDMRPFPADRHTLDIVIEDESDPTNYYLPDEARSGFGAGFSIPGWLAGPMRAVPALHDYATDFGTFPNGTLFPAAVFSIPISRGNFLLAWQLVPLIFVLCLSWLSLLINPARADSRIALATTALLTAVFLQQAALSLFNRTYLVLLDQLYAMAYAFFAANLIMVLLDELQYSEFFENPIRNEPRAQRDLEDAAEGADKPDGESVLLVPNPAPPELPAGESPREPWFAPLSRGRRGCRQCLGPWFLPRTAEGAAAAIKTRDLALLAAELVAFPVATGILCGTAMN